MNKLKVFKSLSAIALMGTMTLTGLTGCTNEKESILDDSLFKSSYIVIFENGNIDIANSDTICNSCEGTRHTIHHSVITGENYTDKECKVNFCDNYVVSKYSIVDTENLSAYLTAEEIVKISKNELTDDDLLAIINRILDNKTEKTKIK